MKNRFMMASVLAAGVLTLGVSAYAYQWNPGIENPDCTDLERHEAVETAFENHDYQAFLDLYDGKGIAKKITSEDDFNKFIELREASLAGDIDLVNELKTELNLWQWLRDGSGSKGLMNWSRQWTWNWQKSGMWRNK